MVTKIRLEADSRCQLHCPLCATGDGRNRNGIVNWGYLTADNFERLLDLNPSIKQVELSNWGEIFLNPEIEKIIRSAYLRGIELTARNGVNFNRVLKPVLVALVECKFRHLTISIDGATQEVYSKFRRGGNLSRVLKNIRELNRLKISYNSEVPELRWQFIAFGHNEHEIELAREMAVDLGMKFYLKLNATADYSPVINKDLISRLSETGASSRAEFRQINGKPYALPCTQLEDEPQVNWDGIILGCCRNTTVSLGDAFSAPIEDCQKNEIYLKTARVAKGANEDPAGTPCISCAIYRTEILSQLIVARSSR